MSRLNEEINKSLRPYFHLSVPSHWMNDPQRPVPMDGGYILYYLYSNPPHSAGGWRRAVTKDNVTFRSGDMSIPLIDGLAAWTGSAVIDESNTSGLGAGTVVALVTQPTNGDEFRQEQYLWYSLDKGMSFKSYGEPVIRNRSKSNWFRDPKIEWDDSEHEWIAAIGEFHSISFYSSKNLINWKYLSKFSYDSPNVEGIECPDFFKILDDSGKFNWVLGGSVRGSTVNLPSTFLYWVGQWEDHEFHTYAQNPHWLDEGFDWYAAVTWPDILNPNANRYAIGWLNNWDYAEREIPTDFTDSFNGTLSIVRSINLKRVGGDLVLLSKPVEKLFNYFNDAIDIPFIEVNGISELPLTSVSYRISFELENIDCSDCGVQVRRSTDGTKHTDIGIRHNNCFYVDRSHSERAKFPFAPYVESTSTISESSKIKVEAFIDKQSVEVFINDGSIVHSNQVFFSNDDRGIALYSHNGKTIFHNLRISVYSENVAEI